MRVNQRIHFHILLSLSLQKMFIIGFACNNAIEINQTFLFLLFAFFSSALFAFFRRHVFTISHCMILLPHPTTFIQSFSVTQYIAIILYIIKSIFVRAFDFFLFLFEIMGGFEESFFCYSRQFRGKRVRGRVWILFRFYARLFLCNLTHIDEFGEHFLWMDLKFCTNLKKIEYALASI